MQLTGVVCILIPVQGGGTQFAWDSALSIALFCVGGVILVTFVLVEKYVAQEPVISGSIFMNRTVYASVTVGFFLGFDSLLTRKIHPSPHSIVFYTLTYYLPICKSGSLFVCNSKAPELCLGLEHYLSLPHRFSNCQWQFGNCFGTRDHPIYWWNGCHQHNYGKSFHLHHDLKRLQTATKSHFGLHGQLISRFGIIRPFMIAGSVINVVAMGLISTLDHNSNSGMRISYLLMAGVGLGGCLQTRVIALQSAVDMSKISVATTLLSFVQTLG
ncbi:hypothetical protein BC936DRAFT_144055, partial [Jimgerdemannia flammicorona]